VTALDLHLLHSADQRDRDAALAPRDVRDFDADPEIDAILFERAFTTPAISASSRARMRGAASITVTLAPRRRWACAISIPIGPPPMTTRCSGFRSSSKIDSLVK